MLKQSTFVAALVFALCGCGAENQVGSEQPTQKRSSVQRETSPNLTNDERIEFADSNNQFAFDLYHRVRAAEGLDKNMFFSPTSVTLALGMTFGGAKGETASEMATALHYELPGERLHAAMNWLSLELGKRADDALKKARASTTPDQAPPDPNDYRFHVINSTWGQRTMTIEAPYLDLLARHYGAGVMEADFIADAEHERARINGWVEDETKKRIKDLLPAGSLDGNTKFVLVNAVHAKLPWFEKMNELGNISFRKSNGSTVNTAAIGSTFQAKYANINGHHWLSVPLKGASIHVVLIAPPANQLAQLEGSLDAKSFRQSMQKMQPKAVNLTMPKVKFATDSIDLSEHFEALGMKKAFTTDADFTGITTDTRLFISKIFHKAMLGIDEKGVEAAAATAVVMRDTSAPQDPVAVRIENPFVLGIYDEPTEQLVFVGHIMDPSDKGTLTE